VPNPVSILEYANLYCGSAPTDDTASNHLTLRSVQLPRLEMQYVDHRPGGSPVSIEIDVIQTRMECKFELIGFTPQVMELLGRQWWGIGNNDYFIYGHVRNWEDGSAVQAEARIRGQLGIAEPSEFKRGGEPFHMIYAIRGIQAYSLTLGKTPIYDWDFFDNVWAVGGYDQNGNVRQRGLRISKAQNS
jgi:phage tail tube protein FII